MNITQLARQVHMSTKDLKKALPLIGFDLGARAIKIDNKSAQAVIRKLGNRAVRGRILHELKELEDGVEAKPAEEVKPEGAGGEILIQNEIVVKELAKKLGVDVTKLVVELMKQGVMASLNERIDFETASIVAEDFGFKAKLQEGEAVDQAQDQEFQELVKQHTKGAPRPPVVVVMGHVDHGKTKLLDAIRKTNVADQESGGITQHIGAYQVEEKGQTITFIDTPGHEAFSMMRSRGAKVADLAILVVAADDGVQPQTIEAVSHIRNAGLPFIVAINKIDKAEANPDKVKTELAEIGLSSEDWGGQTIMVLISAKKDQNIHGLLETLLLVYEVEKDKITADPKGLTLGTIVESHVDKGSGPVATVLVRNGTLRQGDQVLVGGVLSKVRSMKDWRGEEVKEAGPSMPVAVLGFKEVPQVGRVFKGLEDAQEAKRARRVRKSAPGAAAMQKVLQSAEVEKTGKVMINLMVKADVLGSLEAIQESLDKFDAQGVKVSITARGLGHITEADVLRADDCHALLLGFRAYPKSDAQELARTKRVILKSFDVIYDLLDFLAEYATTQISPELNREDMGEIKVLKVFRTDKDIIVVGGEVTQGKVGKDTKFEWVSNSRSMGQGELKGLQSGKEEVSEVVEGQQAGLKLSNVGDIQPGDILKFYKEETKQKKVSS